MRRRSGLGMCGVAGILLLVTGFAGVGESRADSFTVASLQGTYNLKTDAVPADLVGDDGFRMISETLEISADTLTFAPTFSGTGPFALSGNLLTITDGQGNSEVLQATLSDTGNTLKLVDEIDQVVETMVFTRRGATDTSNEVTEANLQGTFDLDVTNTTLKYAVPLISGVLKVAGNTVTASLTFSETRPFALTGNTITLTEVGGESTVLHATLSQDEDTLTLVDRRDTFVYERR